MVIPRVVDVGADAPAIERTGAWCPDQVEQARVRWARAYPLFIPVPGDDRWLSVMNLAQRLGCRAGQDGERPHRPGALVPDLPQAGEREWPSPKRDPPWLLRCPNSLPFEPSVRWHEATAVTVRVAKRRLRIDRLGPGVDQTGADLRIASPGRNQSPAVGSQFAMAAGPCPTQGEFLGGRAVPTALDLSCGWTGIQLVQVVQIIIVKVLSESSAHPCTGSLLDEPGSMLSDERSKLSATPFSALACQVGKRVHWSDSRMWLGCRGSE